LQLTRDAVRMESYKQKQKPNKDTAVSLVFGAPRLGITAFDWGAAFMEARRTYAALLEWTSVDEDDFMVPARTVRGGVGPAGKDAHRKLLVDVLRASGVRDPALTWGSLRPFLNTTGAQTAEPREDRALLGNWSPTSGSVDCYDRALGTRELMVRSRCLQFPREGGRLGAAFELPRAP